MVKNNPKGFFEAVKRARRAVVISSLPVDGDCMASGVAVKYWLKKEGKQVDLLIPKRPANEPPLYINFNKNFRVVNTNKFDYSKYDLLIALDCSNPDQQLADYVKYGKYELPKGMNVAAIDHHKGNDGYTGNIIYELTSSTAELIYRYLYRGTKIPKEIATCLLYGISTDTGHFRWEIHGETLNCAQELINKGADVGGVINDLFFSYHKWELDGLRFCLGKMKFNKELGLTYLSFTSRDMRKMGLNKEKFSRVKGIYQSLFSRTVVGYPLELIFTKSDSPNVVSVSGRSNTLRPNFFDLTALAEKVSGAKRGHPGASGFDVQGTLTQVKKKAFAAVKEIIEENNG